MLCLCCLVLQATPLLAITDPVPPLCLPLQHGTLLLPPLAVVGATSDAEQLSGPRAPDLPFTQPYISSLLGQWVSMKAGTEPGLSCSMPVSESSLGCLFSHRSSPAASERPLWDASLRAPSCLEALRDPQFQPLFQYLLRATASGTTER